MVAAEGLGNEAPPVSCSALAIPCRSRRKAVGKAIAALWNARGGTGMQNPARGDQALRSGLVPEAQSTTAASALRKAKMLTPIFGWSSCRATISQSTALDPVRSSRPDVGNIVDSLAKGLVPSPVVTRRCLWVFVPCEMLDERQVDPFVEHPGDARAPTIVRG